VLDFVAAARAGGVASPVVVAWRDVVRGPDALLDLPDPSAPTVLRIDSFGQSFEVERALLARGWEDARRADVETVPPRALAALREDRGRVLAPRQHHLGLERVLEETASVLAERPAWRVLAPPASVRELFDKRVTSRRYAQLGVPVPRAVGLGDESMTTPEALRARLAADGVERAFVKLSCGSSASCLGVYETGPGAFTTTLERGRGGRRYNSRRLRRYVGAAADELVAWLLREGSIVEELVPKAKLDGAVFDCRVLVIDRVPAFVVVRESAHEITNLHLGGRRGDPEALARAAPPGAIDAALASAVRVFDAHGCFQIGVDVAFEEGFTGHRVLEANAFGDFFPNLTGDDGRSVYEYELDALGLRRG